MLRQQITDAMKEAMKARDERTLSSVRLIMAALKSKDIDARPSGNTDGIPDDQILSMMQAMIKQRRDSIALYHQGNRQDLVDKEEAEIRVIERFLPKQMTDEEMTIVVGAVIVELGAAGAKDMGRVMAALKARYAGRMDFSKAGPKVKTALG